MTPRRLGAIVLELALSALGLAVSFVVALVLSVTLHLNVGPFRRVVASRVGDVLASSFQGKLVLDHVGRIALGGFGGIDEGSARIFDPSGALVGAAYGVRARISLSELLRSLFATKGPLVIHLKDVKVRAIDFSLDRDADGRLGVERAFVTRSAPAKPGDPPGRDVRVAIDRIDVDHAWVHGAPVTGLPIDAAVDGLHGAFLLDGDRITIDADRFALTTRGMPLGADAHGSAEGHLTIPAPSGGGLGAKLTWSGSIAGIADTLTASLDGTALDAVLDAPEVTPDKVRGLWPDSPIDGAAGLHVDVHGTLPKLTTHVRLTAPGQPNASLDILGPVVLADGQTADLHLDARAVDVSAFVSSAPASRVTVAGEVQLARSAAGALSAKAALDLAPSTVAGQRVPSTKVQASAALDAKTGLLHANGTVSANEPGAPTVLSLRLTPRGRSYELAFDGDTHVAALDSVPRIGKGPKGRSDLKTHGVVDFGRGEIDVKLNAEVQELGQDIVTVEHASVAAQVRGSLKAPQVDVTVQGDVLDFGGWRFEKAQVDVHGPLHGADVSVSLDADGDGTPDLRAGGKLAIGAETKIDDVHVHLTRARESVVVRVGQVKIGYGEVAIDPIDVEGLGGSLHGSFSSTSAAAHIQLHGDGVDLMRLERVSRFEQDLGGCVAAIDVDTTLHRDRGDGHVGIELTQCEIEKIKGGSFGLQATLEGRKIAGRLHAEIADVGSLAVSSSAIEIGGEGTLPQSWRKAWGEVRFDGKVDVAKLAAKLPRQSVPLDHVRGQIALQGKVQRDSPTDNTPGLDLSLTTAGLVLVGPTTRKTKLDGAASISPPAWRVEGIDLGLDVGIDGDSGFAAVSARLNDPHGELLALDLKSGAVPYGAIFDKPQGALALLETVPFNARFVVPPRDLKTLPPILALSGVRGEIEADVGVTGTMLTPSIDLSAKVLKGHARSAVALPIDFTVTGHYDNGATKLSVLGASQGARVLDAHADVVAKVGDFLRSDGPPPAWTASAAAQLAALPLDSIVALSDRQVTGTLSGNLAIDDLHKDARARFDLAIDRLKVGDIAYRTGAIDATLDGKSFDATVKLDQPDGSLRGVAHAASRWGAALLPTIDPSQHPTGEVTAKSFRLAVLLPFLDSTFTELDGRMDADVKVSVDPATERTNAQGTATLSQGRFELASIGGEFHDVAGKVTLTPDGVLKVEGLSASAMSGKIEAAATARMNGLALTAANANVLIPQSTPFLLTVEGTQIGTVEGKVNVAVSSAASTTNVKVDVPRLHVELPLTSSRDVQAPGEIPGVKIGLEKTGGPFVPERLDAPREAIVAPAGKTIVTTITLGRDVLVKKSDELNVGLAGSPTFTIADDVRASGQVRLLQGKLQVQGKSFDIDNGTINFLGDPSDPQLVVTASWTASDGTRVYADLRGTLKSPKVTLRSEPAYSQNEIIALLVYGAEDASNPNAQGAAAGGAAAGVAGGAATQPLNRALENAGLRGVSTRVDTTSSIPRADVEIQIARDLSLQIAEVMGVPPPGASPDQTFLTLSWRFARAWTTQATVGSSGTTIGDLIWQHHY